MKELAAAISAHFNATNALKTALGGQLYPHEASQNATFPYGVYYLISSFTDYDFSDEHENIQVQFSLFSDNHSPGESFTNAGLLKTLFDDAALSVTGCRLVEWIRTGEQLVKDPEMDTWTSIIEYEALIEKDR
jgi:hypothetical protein